ncbi:MAG: CHAT domain-containing protein [Caulobacter sp.]
MTFDHAPGTAALLRLSAELEGGDRVRILEAAAIACEAHGWHHLAAVALSGAAVERLTEATVDQVFEAYGEAMVGVLVQGQRLADAWHLQALVNASVGASQAEKTRIATMATQLLARPTVLPGQFWTLPGSERHVGPDALRADLAAVAKRGQAINPHHRLGWTAAAAAFSMRKLNRRVRDAALARLIRQRRSISAKGWALAAASPRAPAAFLQVVYDPAHIEANLIVGTQRFHRRRTAIFEFGRLTRMTADEIFSVPDEEHAFVRHMAILVEDVLSRMYGQDPHARDLLRLLYDLLLGDLLHRPEVRQALAALGSRPTLVVSTHGALSHIPFSALLDGRDQALLDHFDLVQATPVGDTGVGRGSMNWSDVAGGRPMASPRTYRCAVDQLGLQQGPIEQAGYEAMRASGTRIETLADRTWGMAELRSLLASPGVAIVSTHVRSDATSPASAALLLPDGSTATMETMLETGTKADILVLTGCNSSSRADWLSGGGGDDVASLCRQAGAASVVTTLWPIDDLAGRIFNTALVEALDEGLTRAQAHNHAQRVVRAFRPTPEQRHGLERKSVPGSAAIPPKAASLAAPYFWAAFVMSGAWL